MEVKKTKYKGGKFPKGQSGNPTGRPVGSFTEVTRLLYEYRNRRNEFTLAVFQRIESLGDSLVSKAVDLAMEGNEKILMMLLDMAINHNMIKRLEKPLLSKTVEDIDNSQQYVIGEMGDGVIDTVHGMNLVKTLSLKRDTINMKQLEEQVIRITNDESK